MTSRLLPVALPEKYINVRGLAPGKNGEVFRATNSNLDREVFIKLYPISERGKHSALHEPQLLKSFDCEYLTKIYDADILENSFVLLEMEYVSGGNANNLIELAARTGDWPSVGEIISFGMDMCRGLGKLHAKGYIHRDIKPANIVLRQSEAGIRAAVTDLGLAIKLGANHRIMASRHARLYRPPEVWLNKGYSVASDIYQIGVVLYQLCAGNINYVLSNATDKELSNIIISGKLLNFNSLGLHIPSKLVKTIQKCVVPEDRRIPDTSCLIANLQECKAALQDWRLHQLGSDIKLTLAESNRTHFVEVQSRRGKHVISVFKQIGGGARRRVGDIHRLTSAALRSSQKFQRILRDCEVH